MIITTIHDEFTDEILRIMREYDQKAYTIGGDILPIKREMFEALDVSVKKAKRFLAHRAGEKVEPETHFGKVIVTPTGGMGA